MVWKKYSKALNACISQSEQRFLPYQTKEDHKEAKKVLDFYLELIVKAVVPFDQSDSRNHVVPTKITESFWKPGLLFVLWLVLHK